MDDQGLTTLLLFSVGFFFLGFATAWLRLSSYRKHAEKTQTELAVLQARFDEVNRGHAEQLRSLENVRGQIEKDLKLVNQELLERNSETFLKRAQDSLAQREAVAREQMSALVKPIHEGLKGYQEHLHKIESTRRRDEGALYEHLQTLARSQQDLGQQTSKLVNALKSAPKTRGRWGEQQLKNVMEIAGLSEHVDFVLEKSFSSNDITLRPDAVIQLPQGRQLVVDAKTPMAAYLEALEILDDEEREIKLRDHARQARVHMQSLASKSYWSHIKGAADYVVMFMPGENLFTAAVERDPALLVDGIDRRVLITTPTTFVALAHVVAASWRQERLTDNAIQMGKLGQDLYERMSILGERVAKLTQHMDRAVKSHNELVATLESRVMPQARKFVDMGTVTNSRDIATLEMVETTARKLREDRDFAQDETSS